MRVSARARRVTAQSALITAIAGPEGAALVRQRLTEKKAAQAAQDADARRFDRTPVLRTRAKRVGTTVQTIESKEGKVHAWTWEDEYSMLPVEAQAGEYDRLRSLLRIYSSKVRSILRQRDLGAAISQMQSGT